MTCVTPGTAIATPRGEVMAEDLRIGAKLVTRDHGIQEIRQIGTTQLKVRRLSLDPHLQPVFVPKGALGHGLPERDTMVSPQRRWMVSSDRVGTRTERQELLMGAKHLIGPGSEVTAVQTMRVTYIYILCERTEVLLTNGAWSESFQPLDPAQKDRCNPQRDEIYDIFPDLHAQNARLSQAMQQRKQDRELQMAFR